MQTSYEVYFNTRSMPQNTKAIPNGSQQVVAIATINQDNKMTLLKHVLPCNYMQTYKMFELLQDLFRKPLSRCINISNCMQFLCSILPGMHFFQTYGYFVWKITWLLLKKPYVRATLQKIEWKHWAYIMVCSFLLCCVWCELYPKFLSNRLFVWKNTRSVLNKIVVI